jgi:segregation and condensation protein B
LTDALRIPAEAPASTDPLGRSPTLARLEAALFLADEPVPARRLATLAQLPDVAAVRAAIDELRRLLAADESAFQIEEIAGGYQLLTRSVFHPWLVRLHKTGPALKLTPTLLETLTVVAYKQPVMRADIEAIRGVQCGESLRQLMEKGLIRIAGRDDSLGRPVLYATAKKFLQAFGLNRLSDLPANGTLPPPSGS